METSWEQAAVRWCRMDPPRNKDLALGIGGAECLRFRPREAHRARFRRALRYKPQPDVRRLDLALSRSRARQAERVDGRIASGRGSDSPPGGSSRRAYAGASARRRVLAVPRTGSSIPLTADAQHPEHQHVLLEFVRSRANRSNGDSHARGRRYRHDLAVVRDPLLLAHADDLASTVWDISFLRGIHPFAPW